MSRPDGVLRRLFDHPCKFEVCPHLTDGERDTLGLWLESYGMRRAEVPPMGPGKGFRSLSLNRRADRRWWREHEKGAP